MNCECAICKNNKPFDLPQDIIDAAISGDLVLFCGAGISTEGKNVLPYSFYTSIQDELKLNDNTLSFSALMQKYCDQPNGRKKLLQRIKSRFDYIDSFPELNRQATAFHRELAQIHTVKTIITTNWDTYFEEYCGATAITIPEDFAFWDEKTRCVLKIHGSIQNLSSIIATHNDYAKRFYELQNGIIGATLKSILVTKTVVFIGFSFGDEDFNQIIRYLHDELGELFPHIYIVTLDETLKSRLDYKNSTDIITSGTFFLHKLKELLIEKKIILHENADALVEDALGYIYNFHDDISTIDLSKYPCAAYTLVYQDGIIHAFERMIQNFNTGEYNQPTKISKLIHGYEHIIAECEETEKYFDMAYYKGYLNGLIFIGSDEKMDDLINKFPFLYLPNAKEELNSYDVYFKELKRVSAEDDIFLQQAKFVTKNATNGEMVVHHPPY